MLHLASTSTVVLKYISQQEGLNLDSRALSFERSCESGEHSMYVMPTVRVDTVCTTVRTESVSREMLSNGIARICNVTAPAT